jgi:hypothetical protein
MTPVYSFADEGTMKIIWSRETGTIFFARQPEMV